MKKLVFIILFMTSYVHAQQPDTVELKWKISDTLTYKTVMQETIFENDSVQMEEDSLEKEMRNIFKEVQGEMINLKYETKLFPDMNGNIDIVMAIKKEKNDTIETLFSSMAMMNAGIVLRGKVSAEGELLSTYYKRDQSNLISILFELPTKKVKIGDEWNLNVAMISMDQNFVAHTVDKRNTARLKDIIVKNGNKIAIIEYDLKEYVSGNFGNGMKAIFSQNTEEKEGESTFMSMSHTAIAEFDIDQGYWISYDGEMEMETNVSFMGMDGTSTTKFQLIPK